jgi:NAD(P)-dependent dehydrogenase (short-subunit alcohol dehydrogenase family)
LAAEARDVDILVNNAGIYRFAPTFDTTDADFDDQNNTNLRAPTSWSRSSSPASSSGAADR